MGCLNRVYLLNHPLIRDVIWVDLLGKRDHIDEVLFPLRLILSIIGVFLIGTVLEYCRQIILGRISCNDNKKSNGQIT